MEQTFQHILDTIASAPISPEDKESLYSHVYNAMVDTAMPVLLEHLTDEQRMILGDKTAKPTLNELGEMIGSAMGKKDAEPKVKEALTTLFQHIIALLKEQGIS